MTEYILPVVIFLGIGTLAGVLLVVASKFLSVKGDETAARILEVLPGANCGGCGYSGCEGYANAISQNGAPINMCKPGGADVMNAIGEITGQSGGKFVREVAFVRCNGNCAATEDKFVYAGMPSCTAVEKYYNGKGSCRFGCAGLGDCIAVCSNNAIRIENGVAVINPTLCGGCGKCVAACPNHLIFLRRETDRTVVRCSSKDIGKVTRTVCKNGCIGCKICEKKCPEGAVMVSDNHALIDYGKCTSCGACAAACPVKCIISLPVCTDNTAQ